MHTSGEVILFRMMIGTLVDTGGWRGAKEAQAWPRKTENTLSVGTKYVDSRDPNFKTF